MKKILILSNALLLSTTMFQTEASIKERVSVLFKRTQHLQPVQEVYEPYKPKETNNSTSKVTEDSKSRHFVNNKTINSSKKTNFFKKFNTGVKEKSRKIINKMIRHTKQVIDDDMSFELMEVNDFKQNVSHSNVGSSSTSQKENVFTQNVYDFKNLNQPTRMHIFSSLRDDAVDIHTSQNEENDTQSTKESSLIPTNNKSAKPVFSIVIPENYISTPNFSKLENNTLYTIAPSVLTFNNPFVVENIRDMRIEDNKQPISISNFNTTQNVYKFEPLNQPTRMYIFGTGKDDVVDIRTLLNKENDTQSTEGSSLIPINNKSAEAHITVDPRVLTSNLPFVATNIQNINQLILLSNLNIIQEGNNSNQDISKLESEYVFVNAEDIPEDIPVYEYVKQIPSKTKKVLREGNNSNQDISELESEYVIVNAEDIPEDIPVYKYFKQILSKTKKVLREENNSNQDISELESEYVIVNAEDIPEDIPVYEYVKQIPSKTKKAFRKAAGLTLIGGSALLVTMAAAPTFCSPVLYIVLTNMGVGQIESIILAGAITGTIGEFSGLCYFLGSGGMTLGSGLLAK